MGRSSAVTSLKEYVSCMSERRPPRGFDLAAPALWRRERRRLACFSLDASNAEAHGVADFAARKGGSNVYNCAAGVTAFLTGLRLLLFSGGLASEVTLEWPFLDRSSMPMISSAKRPAA